MSSKPIDPAHRIALMQAALTAGPAEPSDRIILLTMVTFARLHTDEKTGTTSTQYRSGARALAKPFLAVGQRDVEPDMIGEIVDPPLGRLAEGGYVTLLRDGISGTRRRPGSAAHWRINLG